MPSESIEASPQPAWLEEWIGRLTVAASRQAGPATLIPLLGPSAAPELITFGGPAAKGGSVREVSDAGVVARVLVENSAPVPLLLLDGEELVGAKQNRVVNASTLVGPHSSLEVPVSCCERGRWRPMTEEFQSMGRSMPFSMKFTKHRRVSRSLQRRRGFDADQAATWRDVNSYLSRRGVCSSTDALSDAFEADRESLGALRREFLADGPASAQVGLAFALRGHLLGLELFGSPALYAQAHERLLHAFFAEALGVVGAPEQTAACPLDLARAVLIASGESRPSTGLGIDTRFEHEGGSGFLLTLDDRPVHAAVFAHKERWSAALGAPLDGEDERDMRRRSRRRNSGARAPLTWTQTVLPVVSPTSPAERTEADEDDPWGVL